MKKALVICLMLAMVISISLSAFAAPNGFVSSPTSNSAPEIVEFDPEDENCTAILNIVPYADRDQLSDTLLQYFNKAFDEITGTDDLSQLNADLARIADEMNIDGKDLAVSDLFDIHVTGCDFHDGHYDFDIILKADTLQHFVGLLHMNKNGEWELVADARVTNNGEHLEFSVESFSPFAIVVDATAYEGSGGVDNVPGTGDNSKVYIYVIIMVVSLAALVFVIAKSKEQKSN